MGKILLRDGGLTIVDDIDEARLARYVWKIDRDGYAYRSCHSARIYLHRAILDPPPRQIVDHINCDKLDNRRCNLRLATRQQNMINRIRPSRNNKSGFIGVRQVRNGRWSSFIKADGKAVNLGTFDTIEEALAARRAAEIDIYKDFAPRRTA